MMNALRKLSFIYVFSMMGLLIYRATCLEHAATYQDMTFYFLMIWWFLVVLTTHMNGKLIQIAPSNLVVSVPLLYVVEQKNWIAEFNSGNVIDNFWERIISGGDWAIKSGKPDNFSSIITTADLYSNLYTAQLIVTMLILIVGIMNAKGIKKFAPKKRKRQKRKHKRVNAM